MKTILSGGRVINNCIEDRSNSMEDMTVDKIPYDEFIEQAKNYSGQVNDNYSNGARKEQSVRILSLFKGGLNATQISNLLRIKKKVIEKYVNQ